MLWPCPLRGAWHGSGGTDGQGPCRPSVCGGTQTGERGARGSPALCGFPPHTPAPAPAAVALCPRPAGSPAPCPAPRPGPATGTAPRGALRLPGAPSRRAARLDKGARSAETDRSPRPPRPRRSGSGRTSAKVLSEPRSLAQGSRLKARGSRRPQRRLPGRVRHQRERQAGQGPSWGRGGRDPAGTAPVAGRQGGRHWGKVCLYLSF